MARPATGSLKWRLNPETGREQWFARVTMPDGKRPLVELDPKIRHDDEEGARACALHVSNLARGIGSPGETVSSWFKRYYAMREKRGDRSVARSRQLFAGHVAPILGDKAMSALSSDDLRSLVRYLEAEMDKRSAFYATSAKREKGQRKPGMLSGTALNVWGEVTAACNEATTSNDDTFRVCKTNPLDGARGPRGGKDRTQAALYPSEVTTLLSCHGVRLERRRIYAVAIYSGLRQAELRGLRAGDVDLERMFINVRGQARTAGKRTTTKTAAGLRQVPIEPALAPLLHALVGARKTGPLLHVPVRQDCAYYVRRDLAKAELTREELHVDDESHKPFDFHGLRHTYLTHLAMHPDASTFMLAAAGHTDLRTSQRYVAGANLLRRGRFGEPHPALPPDLYEIPVDGVRVSAFVSDFGSPNATIRRDFPAEKWADRDSNPGPTD